LINTNCIYPE
jgi:hypothetical protein